MIDDNEISNGIYGALSKSLQEAYTKGEWNTASEILTLMATVLEGERKYIDAMKALILSFYIDTSGIERPSVIKSDTVDRIQKAYSRSGMSESEIMMLYYDVIKNDTLPKHNLTLTGSFRVFTYCLFGKNRKLAEVMSNLEK